MFSKRNYIKTLTNVINENENRYRSKIHGLIQSLENKPVFIYGAGNAGKQIFGSLNTTKKTIYAFIDQNVKKSESISDVPILSLSELSHVPSEIIENSVVIIGLGPAYFSEYPEIKEKLSRLGFNLIIDYFYYYHFFIQRRIKEHSDNGCSESSFFEKNKVQIFKAADFFNDSRSQEIFVSYLDAFFSVSSEKFAKPEQHEQYFPNDVPLNKGYTFFIDCGAYDGDTFCALNRVIKNVRYYVAFEPDIQLYRKLSKRIKSGINNTRCLLVPCGVYDKTISMNFSSHDSVSRISSSGDQVIQCVSIDDVLCNTSPSFIKMDIEGVEYEAIQGAKETIKGSKPDLAICVYHWVDDMWRIPLLINEICPGYRFYLRTYSSMGLETVLYASYDPSEV